MFQRSADLFIENLESIRLRCDYNVRDCPKFNADALHAILNANVTDLDTWDDAALDGVFAKLDELAS